MSAYDEATEQAIRIEQAKNVLRKAGYYVDNLWSIPDVQEMFECDNETAMKVLNNALTSDTTIEQIWFAIELDGNDKGLTRKEL